MNFQEVLIPYTLSDSSRISREEQERFSLLLKDLKKRSVESQEDQLIYDIIDGKEIVAILKNGKAREIDFVSWNILLGCQVDVTYLEKQTTIHHFVSLVLRHMTYEGLDEQKRETRIQELQRTYPLLDCDTHSWYEMTRTVQGKNGLLVVGEIYHRDEFLNEDVSIAQLLEEAKTFLW